MGIYLTTYPIMKFVIALLIVALFGGAFAQEKESRATLFVEGVSVGVTADIGNVTECTKDLVVSLESFDKALPAIKAGMLTANRDLVKSAVPTFGAAVEEVSKAFTVCAVFATAESTDTLASSMKIENTADFFAGLLSEKDTVEDLSAPSNTWKRVMLSLLVFTLVVLSTCFWKRRCRSRAAPRTLAPTSSKRARGRAFTRGGCGVVECKATFSVYFCRFILSLTCVAEALKAFAWESQAFI